MGDEADEIWGHCVGYPGRRDKDRFVSYFARHSLPTQYYFAGYAPFDVRDIQSALTTARAIRRDALVATDRTHHHFEPDRIT